MSNVSEASFAEVRIQPFASLAVPSAALLALLERASYYKFVQDHNGLSGLGRGAVAGKEG